ncbi:MAG TPA: VWA domain-containing protein [Pyrinomonadaceae bacterium]|nr:VWA domain-containing protein [Pyrinomonadaceae bacterium]
MRRLFAALSLLALLAAPAAFAQTRPRRAETDQPQTAPRPTTPTRPVLNGRTTGDAPPAGTEPRAGEPSEEEVDEEGVVRVETALVTIPVTVLDRDGRYVPNIRKEEFRLYEDGVEQRIAYFAQVDVPFTVALVIDTSNSTRFQLDEIQDAAIAFVEQLRPADRVLVISFDDDVHVLSEATSDRRALREAIRRTRTGQSTKLYDAVDFVIKQRLDGVTGRKAVVLFTDGVDTSSRRASYESTVADAEELDAIIYPISYDTLADMGGGGGRQTGSTGDVLGDILGRMRIPLPLPVPKRRPGGGTTSRADYERGARYLRTLADMTGGSLHPAHDLNYLSRAFENIAEELRRQYSLGYYPSRQTAEAERRRVKVRVYRPNLAVRARDSYVYKPAGDSDKTARRDDDTQQSQPRPELRRRPFAADATMRK